MSNLNIKLSALVVTFNRIDELIKTVNSLLFNGFQESDIFVINNNSTDKTEELVSSSFPDINLINLTENIASAGGFAKGLEISFKKGYDWCFLCNDDSRPKEGCVESMMSALDLCSDSNIGFLKVANLNPKGDALLLKWKGIGIQYSIPVSNDLIKTDLITFDGCMISSRMISKIGYCDSDFFMGVYEYDYCLRAKDNGFSAYVLPNGLLEDGKLGSVTGTPPWRQYYNTRNLLWLGIKRKSFLIIKGWLIRELKYSYSIIFFGDKKIERMKFKFLAIRDAILNKRGRTFDPSQY
jgi:GT2 family glycosyltransferase